MLKKLIYYAIKYGGMLLRLIRDLLKNLKASAMEEVESIRANFEGKTIKDIVKDATNEGVRFFGTALLLEGLNKYPTNVLTKARPFISLPYEDCTDGKQVRPLLLGWRMCQQITHKSMYGTDFVATRFHLGF